MYGPDVNCLCGEARENSSHQRAATAGWDRQVYSAAVPFSDLGDNRQSEPTTFTPGRGNAVKALEHLFMLGLGYPGPVAPTSKMVSPSRPRVRPGTLPPACV